MLLTSYDLPDKEIQFSLERGLNKPKIQEGLPMNTSLFWFCYKAQPGPQICLNPASSFRVLEYKASNLVQGWNVLSLKLESIPILVRIKKTQQSSTNIEILF